MKICSKCKIKKAGRHFNHDADGVPNQQCKKCEAGIEGNAVIKARREDPPEAAPVPVTMTDTLEVLPGFGFRSAIESGHLSIAQDSDDGTTDNVILSRTELKVLFAQYAEWAGLMTAA